MTQDSWAAAVDELGDVLACQLLALSPAALSRLAEGAAPPPEVRERLEVVSQVHARLRGSYDAAGIRNWWLRPRAALGGQSPLEALGEGAGSPDGAGVAAVLRLSGSLAGAGSSF